MQCGQYGLEDRQQSHLRGSWLTSQRDRGTDLKCFTIKYLDAFTSFAKLLGVNSSNGGTIFPSK